MRTTALFLLIAAISPAAVPQQAPAPAKPVRAIEANVVAYDWTVRLREPEDEFFERIIVRINDPEEKQEKPELAQVIYSYTDLEKHRPPDYFFRRRTRLRLQLPAAAADEPTCDEPQKTTVAVETSEGAQEMVELSTFAVNGGLRGDLPDVATLPCYVITPAELEILDHD